VSPRSLAALSLAVALALAAPALGADPPALAEGARLFDQGRDSLARVALLPLATTQPPSAAAAYYLGRLALRADDPKAAARWFETAVKLESGSSSYHLWLGRAHGTQAQRANVLSQPGLAKKTKSEFERAAALDPDNLDAREDLISYYLEAPGIMGGSVEKARAQAVEIRKRDAFRGAVADARIAEDQKDLAGAEREYLAAARAFPESLNVHYALGQFYARTAKYEQAFATFEGILAAKPDELNALYAIGRTGAISGQRLERAEAALQQFLAAPLRENSQRPAAAHWRLGMIYEKGGKRDLAREEYRRSLALDPGFAEAKKSLAKLK